MAKNFEKVTTGYLDSIGRTIESLKLQNINIQLLEAALLETRREVEEQLNAGGVRKAASDESGEAASIDFVEGVSDITSQEFRLRASRPNGVLSVIVQEVDGYLRIRAIADLSDAGKDVHFQFPDTDIEGSIPLGGSQSVTDKATGLVERFCSKEELEKALSGKRRCRMIAWIHSLSNI